VMRCPREWEIYRRPNWVDPNDMGDSGNGNLVMPSRGQCIVFSNGEGWEHVSVSFKDRCPTWEEMEDVKRRFWQDTDTVMQLHVPVSEHRNCHPYCLHLWRPTDREIPRPPGIFVAPDALPRQSNAE
jgi:hypothetical protein